MPLALPRRERRLLWPSFGAGVVVAGVFGVNLWSLATSSPEPAQLQPLERLQALKETGTVPARLPPTATAMASNQQELGASGDSGAATMRSDGTATAPGFAAAVPRIVQALDDQSMRPGDVTRSWVVRPGEGLSAALAGLYVPPMVARAVVKAYSTVRDTQKLQAGWRLWARFTGAGVVDVGALQSVVVAPFVGEGVTIARTSGNSALAPTPANEPTFVAREGGLPGTRVRVAVRCGVRGSLEDSLRRCGEGEALAGMVDQLLSDRLAEPVELHTGDEVRLVVDKLVDGEMLVRYLRLVALQWRPAAAQPGDPARTAYWFDGAATAAGYHGRDGRSLEALFLRQPLQVGHTTSGFGMRVHPVLHTLKAHYGVDFGAPRGTPVYAASDGWLVSAGRAGAAGNLVKLRHAHGWASEYMHLQRFVGSLERGDRVAKGQLIGYVGSTGRTTGPHLHFGVKRHGRYVDPQSLGDELRLPVPASDHRAFDQHARALDKLLRALDSGGDAS
jgi:hypothetical protein